MIDTEYKSFVYDDCGHDKTVYPTKCDTFIYCPTCARGEADHSNERQGLCCSNPSVIDVNYPRKDGVPLKRDFCQNCGWYRQKKMDTPDEWKRLPLITEAIVKDLEKARSEKRASFFAFCKMEKEELIDQRNGAFWESYTAYLSTDAWRMIRAKVLKRDNNLCQGCLENPATQVHHLTYEHVFNEFMHELISVCKSCHDRIHDTHKEDEI